MTDEQLRTMARRIYDDDLHRVTRGDTECYVTDEDEFLGEVERMLDRAVEIMREEMDRANVATTER